MLRRSVIASAAVVFALCGTAAHASEEHWTATPEGYAKHLSDVGAWDFSAMKKGADGKPECYETWTFKRDGTGGIVSGDQEIALSWRYVQDDVLGMLLRITYEGSTAGPDCLGREVDSGRYPRKNGAGFALLFFGGGQSAYVCSAPKIVVDENKQVRTRPDSKPMTLQSLENCWGNLAPASLS